MRLAGEDREAGPPFVVGTGGFSHHTGGSSIANEEVRNVDTFGVLKLTLHPSSYDWEFIPIASMSFTDSGCDATHGLPGSATPAADPCAP